MLTAALVFAASALAQGTPFEPTAGMLSWPEGETRRLYSTMAFTSPYVIPLIAVRNEERYAAELALSAVLRCEALGWMRSATEIRCQVEDAGVQATPMVSDVGKLQAVLNDWESAAEASTVYFRVRDDGRVDRVRLEDLPNGNPRDRYIAGRLEVFMARLLSPLDLELPSEPSLTWKHRSPSVGNLPFSTTGGSLRLQHSAVVDSGSVVVSGSGSGQVVSQFSFAMNANTQHQIGPECHCILRGSVEVHGVANTDTGQLGYRMAGYTVNIADQALDAPLTSWDLSVPR